MGIENFTFDPELTDSFVRFGSDLYRADPHYVPPVSEELSGQLSPQFLFYRKAGHCHRHFLAGTKRQTVGRVSAFVNPEVRDGDGTPVGTIGFFESVEDPAIARELFDSAIGWLRDGHGIKRVWGPMNFDIWHGYRLMTRGFGEKSFYGEPYNKAYYPAFFESYGFSPRQHWYSAELTGHDLLEKLTAAGAARYHKLIEKGYRIEPFDCSRFSEELRKLHPILMRSFKGFLGFTAIPLAEFEELFTSMRPAFHPDLFFFVYDQSDRLAGFAGAFLDLAEMIRSGPEHGLLACPRPPNRILFYLCGMSPEEAVKGGDFARAVFYYAVQRIRQLGCDSILVALMARGKAMTRMVGLNLSAAQRQYTLYKLNL